MRKRLAGVLLIASFLLLACGLLWAEGDTPHNYFGPGPGYPDLGSKYFYRYYPPDQWQTYGYGTGHMGVGYGPYMYAGERPSPAERDALAYGPPLVRPQFKRVGNGQVSISVPGEGITRLTVNVLSASGAVLETGCVNTAPFEIVANLPDGTNSVQVRVDTVDGFRAIGYPLYW
jgi:hypothetical protein